MSIPEETLRRWTQQGPTGPSATAYGEVTRAIERATSLADRRVDVYLQGSYRNSTNLPRESDIDVVVQADQTFFYSVDRVDPAEAEQIKKTFSLSTYSWSEYRADVLAALESYFGASRVRSGNKSIKVTFDPASSLYADVVPAFTYRLYVPGGRYLEGMSFRTQNEDRLVVNYPKLHYSNGVDKQAATKDEFKSTVRLFKTMRTEANERNLLAQDAAPSYFVECLIWNVDNSNFGFSSWSEQFRAIWSGLNSADLSTFRCQNGVMDLFGGTPEQWRPEEASRYVQALAQLWNNWT